MMRRSLPRLGNSVRTFCTTNKYSHEVHHSFRAGWPFSRGAGEQAKNAFEETWKQEMMKRQHLDFSRRRGMSRFGFLIIWGLSAWWVHVLFKDQDEKMEKEIERRLKDAEPRVQELVRQELKRRIEVVDAEDVRVD